MPTMIKKKKIKSKRPSKNEGYGAWDEARPEVVAPNPDSITHKSWAKVTSMDVYDLFRAGWRTSDICRSFSVKSIAVYNKLTRL